MNRIGDEEIDVAARWMAGARRANPTRNEVAIPGDHLEMSARGYATYMLRKARDEDARESPSIYLRHKLDPEGEIFVVVMPGEVRGYVNGTTPEFAWKRGTAEAKR
jgi:hypothetical protein